MSEEQGVKAGSICHIEIPGPDLGKLEAFYGALFGWTFTAMGDEYLLFGDGDGGGGGFDPSMPVTDGGAVLVLAVEDIETKLAEIAEAGGEVLSPKTEISGNHGLCAYFRDPCGNKMCVWSKS